MTTPDPERHDVSIVVPAPSTATESYLHSGPAIHTPDYTVIVPVTGELLEADEGINVRRFVQTAVALAADNDGRVLLLGLAVVDSEASLTTIQEYVHEQETAEVEETDAVDAVVEQQAQIAQLLAVATAINPEVSVSAVVRTVSEKTQGVLDAADRQGETAVLLLRGTSFDEGWLLGRSTIDTVLNDADCDVFVENIGIWEGPSGLYVPDVGEHTVAPLNESEEETIDSILLPVGTGPHSALAAEAARAIARAADAPVTVVHVVSPDTPTDTIADANDLLRFAEYVLGPDVTVETETREASDMTDVIIQEAQTHDFTLIGAPEERSRLEKFIFESIQDTLSKRRDVTVLMARDSDRILRSLYYRWKQGMETAEDNYDPN